MENSDCGDIIAQGIFLYGVPLWKHLSRAMVLLMKSTFIKESVFWLVQKCGDKPFLQWLACAISITELNSLVIIKHIGLHIKGITEVQGYHFNIKSIKCEI